MLGIDFLGRSDGIHTPIGNLEAREWGIGEQDELAVWILSQTILMALGGIHRKSLDVWISLVVGIIENGCPYLVLVPFLQSQDVVLVMVVHIEVGDVEFAVVEYYQDRVIIVEFSQESAVLIIVDAVYIRVKPYLSSSQGTVSVALQSDAADGSLGEQVALGSTSLDEDFREIFLQEDALTFFAQIRFHRHLDDFCLAVRVGGEVDDAASRCALGDIVELVARHGGYVESLDEVVALLAVAIYAVVDGSLIVLLEHLYVEDVLTHEYLVGNLGYLEFSILVEDDDVVEVRAVAHKFILLQACTHETFLSVDVEFLVGFHHLGHLDGIEVPDFGFSRMHLSVLALEILKPVDGDIGHVGEVVFYFSQFCLDLQQEVIRLILIIFQDSLHLDFQELEDVVACDVPVEGVFHVSLAVDIGGEDLILERLQLGVDECHYLVLTLALLELALLVDALLYEDAFERGEEELLFQLALSDHQFASE